MQRVLEVLVGVHPIHRGMHGRFEVRIGGVDPAGPVGRLAHRLLGVRMHPVGLDQPDPGEGLGEQVRQREVWDLGVLGEIPGPGEELRPEFGQHRQSGPDVLAPPLGVMGGQGGHRLRPQLLAALLGGMEVLGGAYPKRPGGFPPTSFSATNRL